VFDDGACVCEDGSALTEHGCEACGRNAEVVGNECVCSAGFELNASKECEASRDDTTDDDAADDTDANDHAMMDAATTGAPGAACDVDGDCDEPFAHCRTEPSASVGYCTSVDCEDDAECPETFMCQREVTPSFCKRPPTGIGRSCEDNDDCEGYDAWMCNAFDSRCVVTDCLSDPDAACFRDQLCCDFSVFGGPSICIPEDELDTGECPI
jgi:hypothetical protein